MGSARWEEWGETRNRVEGTLNPVSRRVKCVGARQRERREREAEEIHDVSEAVGNPAEIYHAFSRDCSAPLKLFAGAKAGQGNTFLPRVCVSRVLS